MVALTAPPVTASLATHATPPATPATAEKQTVSFIFGPYPCVTASSSTHFRAYFGASFFSRLLPDMALATRYGGRLGLALSLFLDSAHQCLYKPCANALLCRVGRVAVFRGGDTHRCMSAALVVFCRCVSPYPAPPLSPCPTRNGRRSGSTCSRFSTCCCGERLHQRCRLQQAQGPEQEAQRYIRQVCCST